MGRAQRRPRWANSCFGLLAIDALGKITKMVVCYFHSDKRRTFMIRYALILVFILFGIPVAVADIYTVDDDGDADFDKIQEAINIARDGDTIWVEDGTYTGTGNVEIDPDGKAITICSANGPTRCIIDCQGSEDDQRRAFVISTGETQDTVIEGFTLTGGWSEKDATVDKYWGGGMIIYGSSPTIRNCIFTGNFARYGGALVIDGVGNNATPLLENCTFHGNIADSKGGALRVLNGCQVTMTNCIIWGNQSQNDTAHEVLIEEADDVSLILNYCVIRDEDNTIDGEILWGAGNCFEDPQFVQSGQWVNERYILGDLHIQSTIGHWDDANEVWVSDDVYGPGIDAGDPNSDYLQEYWPHGQRANIGAYGGLAEASQSTDFNGVGDLDGDENVDLRDLMILADHWLETPRLWVGDMDLNGIVNLVDWSVLCYFWQRTNTCPTPTKMQWASDPNLIDGCDNAVTMTAVTATSTDSTDVEYWFYEIYDANLNSGWIDTPTWCIGPDPNVAAEWTEPYTWTVYDLEYSEPYWFRVKARNIGNQKETQVSGKRWVKTLSGYDYKPSDAEWETEPYRVDVGEVNMVAVEGSDDRGDVEYKFICYDEDMNEVEEYSSDWQSSRSYQIGGLADGMYYFVVVLRDNAGQEGDASDKVLVDLLPPSPDPMEWDIEPYYTTNTLEDDDTNYKYLFTMTATEAEDDSDVEYYFWCKTSDYTSSWQESNTYSMAVFATTRKLTFRVKARDKYGNETEYSEGKATSD